MGTDRYTPYNNRMWKGNVSQCFSCKARHCSRNRFKKNNVGGIEVASKNPGVILKRNLCKNWKE